VKNEVLLHIILLLSFKTFSTEGFELLFISPVKTLSQKEFKMEYNKDTKEYIFYFGNQLVRKNFESEDWQKQLEALKNAIEVSFKVPMPIYQKVFGHIRMNMLKGHNFTPPEMELMAKSWERALEIINRPVPPVAGDCDKINPAIGPVLPFPKDEIEFWNKPAFIELQLNKGQSKSLLDELVDKALAKEGFAPAESLFDLNVGKMKKDDPLGSPQKSTEELLKEWIENKSGESSAITDSAPLNFAVSKIFKYDRNTTIDVKQESIAINGQAGQSYLIGDKSYHSFLRKVGDDYKEFLSVDRVEMEVLHELNSERLFLRVNGAVNYMSNENGFGKIIFENWQRFQDEGVASGSHPQKKSTEVDANLSGALYQKVQESIYDRLDLLAGYEVGINLNNSWSSGSFASSKVEVGADLNTFNSGQYRGFVRGTVYFNHDQFFDNNKTQTIGAEISGRIFQRGNQVFLIVAGANNNLKQAEQDQKIFAEVNSYFGLRSMIKF
jgi:hypothetical protein